MAGTLAIAVGVPAVLGVFWFASRQSWSPACRDCRGIALQTVIVIVVMLVIAGGVAGVLLSRGTEVMSDLENQETASVNATNCTSFPLNTINGTAIAATSGNNGGCKWQGTAASPISATVCTSVRNSSNGSSSSFHYTPSGSAFTLIAAAAPNPAFPAVTTGTNTGGLCQIAF